MSQEKSNQDYICPNCKNNDAVIRIKRTSWQRLISLAIPVQRYECYYCGWQGLVRKPSLYNSPVSAERKARTLETQLNAEISPLKDEIS